MLKMGRIPLKFRLLGSMVSLVILIVIGNTLIENYLQVDNAKKNLVREVQIANRVLSQDYVRLLYTDESSIAADIVLKLESFPMIQQADILNQDALVLLHFERQQTESQPLLLEALPKEKFLGDSLLISFPVIVNNRVMGEVRYAISTQRIADWVQLIYWTNLWVAVMSIVVAIIGAYFLHSVFAKKDLHINFLENLEKVNEAIHSAKSTEEMLNAVLKTVQEIFATDRAWLLYPCNPGASHWHVPMEITKAEFPGALAQGEDIPMNDEIAKVFRDLLKNNAVKCVDYSQSNTAQVTAKHYSTLSEMHIALHPKMGDAWVFGVHQCAYKRKWSESERNLFTAISRRMTDGLNSLLFLRNLSESEARNHSLLDSTAEAIYGLDINGLCTFCNASCLRMLGLKHQDKLLHKPVHAMIHHAHTDGIDSPVEDWHVYKAYKANQKSHTDSEVIYRADGSYFFAEYWAYPISEKGRVVGCVVTFMDISQRKKQEEKLNYLASHDMLTGLMNRYEFEQRISKLLDQQSENKGQHALCFLDLDQFKVVNDTCGHIAGDELLKQLSQILPTVLRKKDILARIGGDEFAVLLHKCSVENASCIAHNMLDLINNYQFIWEGHFFKIGVSIGLIPIDEIALSVSDVFALADTACYLAKDSGRNQVHVYHPKDTGMVEHQGEMQWVARIYQAIDENRFQLFAQAIVPLQMGAGQHFEILLRMQDEKSRTIPPDAFLPAAERYDIIDQLDTWVLKTSFKRLAQSPEFLDSVNFISINLSGKSLTKSSFLSTVIEMLGTTKIPANKICFEITETAAIANLSIAIDFITTLKSFGFRFALDDFGSGLSSFAYLKSLPVDYLKIDGLFVRDIVEDPIDYEMVKSMNNIGHVMGMKTIAEFVENDEILQMITDIGVNYAQGYGVGKPVLLEKLLD